MEGQGCDGTLVANVDDEVVVGLDATMEPFHFRGDDGRVAHGRHGVSGLCAGLHEVVDVELMAAGIGKAEGALVGAVDVGEIGGVGIDAGAGQRLLSLGIDRDQHHQGDNQLGHALWQTEEETAPLPLLALGREEADSKDLAELAILLDDALAVEQAKAMTARYLVVEDAAEGFGVHAFAVVGHGDLDVGGLLVGIDADVAASGGELAGIVGQGVEHEERQHTVGLDSRSGGTDVEFDALHEEAALALGDDVEEVVECEGLDVEAELALMKLYPAGQYTAYEDELKRSNALDFDDLLLKTYILFRDCPEVADYYSEKFNYIHIDEFQDTNKVQMLLAERLAIKHRNIFVVGDDDQSIYGWRGAKIENILEFDALYKNAKIYKLERNYRSTKKILNLANAIIANNKGRREKTLWTDNGEGARVETFVGNDENNEADYVAIQIKNLMVRYPDYDYKDFAVFMRLNALTRAFEQEFTKYGIPYRVFGGFRFFERKEIKDLLAYLKVINNPKDDESFLRCVASPKRGIGDKTLSELREYAISKGLSIREAISDLSFTTISPSARVKLANFNALLDSFKDFSDNNKVSETLKHVIEATGFNNQFTQDDEDESKLMNVGELLNSAEQFEKDNGIVTLSDYLNSVTLSSDTDDIESGNVVTLATIHSVKGLEFPCVFVVGLDEKILPISRSFGDDEDLEEERRLIYVAVTRARERLYLTRASSRYMYGSREFMAPSRFIKEGAEALGYAQPKASYSSESRYGGLFNNDSDDGLGAGRSGYSSAYAKSMLVDNKPKANANANTSAYKSGVKVKHVRFGEGTVIMVKGSADNLVVDVAFKGVGVKSLSVKYAPMEIIK